MVIVSHLGLSRTLTVGLTNASLSPDPAFEQSSSSSVEHPEPCPENMMSSDGPSPRGVV